MAQDTIEKQLIAKLQEQLGFLALLANSPSDARFASKYSDVTDAWEKLRDQVSKSKSRDIGDFFEAIGSGVIEAQRKLDERSEEYVRSLLAKPEDGTASAGADKVATVPSTASLFRIPRVSAELKCSLETTKGKSLNLIFYSDRNDVRELHQQTISMEVVAVPVPPDYLNQMKKPDSEEAEPEIITTESTQTDDNARAETDRPVPFFLPGNDSPQGASMPSEPLSFSDPEPESASGSSSARASDSTWMVQDEAERRKICDIVKGILQKHDAREDTTADQESGALACARRFLLPSWSNVICLSDGNNSHFLAVAVEQKRPRLLLFQLTLRPASLRLLYKLPKQKSVQRELGRLFRFVAGLGDKQATASKQ